MGRSKHDGLTIPGRVVLAHEPPFALGKTNVDPSTRQIEVAGRSETLEPRVMQVLVALARADGAIVTRDELIELCWDGRIVTDDAINRVLSRIRQVAADIGGGSFGIETIARVGYRLTEEGRPHVTAIPKSRSGPAPESAADRRGVLVGAVAVAAAAGASLLAWSPWRHRPSAQARELFRRGDFARREFSPSELPQAKDYFREAVRIDPSYAEAWGALALSYVQLSRGDVTLEGQESERLTRSAAARALALDPDNADARVALAVFRPSYGRWKDFESGARALLGRYPDHWYLRSLLGGSLYDTGRWTAGLEQYQILLRANPALPVVHGGLAYGLWNAGRLQEAEQVLNDASQRWPSLFLIWDMKYWFLALNGRPREAVFLATDTQSQPVGLSPTSIPRRLAFARALETRTATDIDKALSYFEQMARTGRDGIAPMIEACAALGRVDQAFACCDAYFFDRGPLALPTRATAYSYLQTRFLFEGVAQSLRADPRFGKLLDAIGLEKFWRAAGIVPDFRKS